MRCMVSFWRYGYGFIPWCWSQRVENRWVFYKIFQPMVCIILNTRASIMSVFQSAFFPVGTKVLALSGWSLEITVCFPLQMLMEHFFFLSTDV